MQQVYYEKLLKISQREPKLMHKLVSDLWDLAGDMTKKKNHYLFKLINENN